jgi:hypothetical protein
MPLPTTPQWDEAIKAQFRRQGYLRVRLSLERPEVRDGAVITAATQPPYDVNWILSTHNDVTVPRVTLEHNRWDLGGNFRADVAPEAWASQGLVGTGPIILNVQFDQLVSFPQFTTVWDTETNSWPISVDVLTFSPTGNYTYQFRNLDGVSQVYDVTTDEIDRMEVHILEWKHPRWRARAVNMFFGLVIEFPQRLLMNAQSKHKLSLMSAELPHTSFNVTFSNFDKDFDPLGRTGYSQYLWPRLPMEIQWGFMVDDADTIQWLPVQHFFLIKQKSQTDQPHFQFQMGTRLDFLTGEYKAEEFDGVERTLLDVADRVLKSLQLYTDLEPWVLDPNLANFTTIAPVPNDPENVVLQLIANAAGMILDVNTLTGEIEIRQLNTIAQRMEITTAHTNADPSIVIEDRLLSVKVAVNQYMRDSAISELFNSSHEKLPERRQLKLDMLTTH